MCVSEMLLTICQSRSTNLSPAQLCWHIQCKQRALPWVSSEAGAAQISCQWQPQPGTGSGGRSAAVPQMQGIVWAAKANTCCLQGQTEQVPLTPQIPIEPLLYQDLKSMAQLFIILAVTTPYLCHKENRRLPLGQRLVKKQRKCHGFFN